MCTYYLYTVYILFFFLLRLRMRVQFIVSWLLTYCTRVIYEMNEIKSTLMSHDYVINDISVISYMAVSLLGWILIRNTYYGLLRLTQIYLLQLKCSRLLKFLKTLISITKTYFSRYMSIFVLTMKDMDWSGKKTRMNEKLYHMNIEVWDTKVIERIRKGQVYT